MHVVWLEYSGKHAIKTIFPATKSIFLPSRCKEKRSIFYTKPEIKYFMVDIPNIYSWQWNSPWNKMTCLITQNVKFSNKLCKHLFICYMPQFFIFYFWRWKGIWWIPCRIHTQNIKKVASWTLASKRFGPTPALHVRPVSS